MKRIEVTGKKLKELFYFTMFIPTLNVTKINDINVYNIYDDNTLKNSMDQVVGFWKGMPFQESQARCREDVFSLHAQND